MIAHSGVNYGYRTCRKRTVVIRTVTYYSIGQDVDNLFTSPGTDIHPTTSMPTGCIRSKDIQIKGRSRTRLIRAFLRRFIGRHNNNASVTIDLLCTSVSVHEDNPDRVELSIRTGYPTQLLGKYVRCTLLFLFFFWLPLPFVFPTVYLTAVKGSGFQRPHRIANFSTTMFRPTQWLLVLVFPSYRKLVLTALFRDL